MIAETLRPLQELNFVFAETYTPGEGGLIPVYGTSVMVTRNTGAELVRKLSQKISKRESVNLEFYSLHGLLETAPIVAISSSRAEVDHLLRGIEGDKIDIEVALTTQQLLAMTPDTDFSMGY